MLNQHYRSFKLILLIFSASAIVFFSGCSKDDSNPVNPGGGNNQTNKITFTGGAYNNQTFNLTGVYGGYSVGGQISVALLSGMAGQDSMTIVVAFPGSTTGTFSWQDASSDETTSGVIISISNDPNKWYMSNGPTGSTAVTTYGAVGSTIVGTFSGKVYSVTDSSTVSGTFSVPRGPDGE